MARRRAQIHPEIRVTSQASWWGPISRALDGIVNALKWPCALLALLLLPLSVIAVLRLAGRIWSAPTPVMAFTFGLVAYFAAWHLIFRRRLFGTFFSTLEHELTHAIFALATFHPVRKLRSTFTQGGHVEYLLYKSQGNWLITISPYFVPTLSFALMLVLAFVPPDYRGWTEWLLGAVTAYHINSTMQETRLVQPDLQKVGYLFSFLFLPAANVIAFGIIVAFSHAGIGGVMNFLTDLIPHFLSTIV